MKKTIALILLLLTAIHAYTQSSNGIAETLRSIAANNMELKMNDYQSLVVKSQYAAANALPAPAVSYTRQYGNREGLGINGELIASQSLDFPTLYAQRSKLFRSKAQSLDLRQAELRRQILLEAKEICLDLIMLRKESKLLAERLGNATQLEALYSKRLETGDANRIETNKISLELLNVKTEARRNATAVQAKLKELETLNGGEPLDFDATLYEAVEEPASFDELCSEVLDIDPGLNALRSELSLAGQALRVSKAGWLPSLELGYQLNTATGGERFNGFLVGINIPVFSNRHKVRQAKAETIYAGLRYDDAAMKNRNELLQLHRLSLALKESMNEYDKLLENRDNLPLLNKALDSGRISVIEYFVEVASLYDSLRNYMQLENEYQKTVARMLRHRL
ncbi:MAG: TolC family protein [Tannerellaceae bacterium]|jgi:outer membrane protein TolC|nr:TolC family protein [Tannerellaceae bacterium]